MAQRFFRCMICGNMVGLIASSGVPLMCCGQEMRELIGNSVDAALEKHVPKVSADGNSVCVDVGAISHPMLDEHFIEWVYLKTEMGGQRRELKPGDSPKVVFLVADGDRATTVYAYCNLHGLWKTELEISNNKI